MRDRRGAGDRRRRAGAVDRAHRGLGCRPAPGGAVAARRGRISAPRCWSSRGDNRHLVDYLGEQVLAGARARGRALPASDLDPRAGSARPCATRSPARRRSAELLAEVERANLFLVPLDGRRRWYRYHHLFSGLLQAELASREPELVPRSPRTRLRLAPGSRHGHRGCPSRDPRRRLRGCGRRDHGLVDNPDPLRALGDGPALVAPIPEAGLGRGASARLRRRLRRRALAAEPRRRSTNGCGSPNGSPRRPKSPPAGCRTGPRPTRSTST